jgi:hypothetical protein
MYLKGIGGCGPDSSVSKYRPELGACDHSNEPSGSVKDGTFIDYLRDH